MVGTSNATLKARFAFVISASTSKTNGSGSSGQSFPIALLRALEVAPATTSAPKPEAQTSAGT